MIGGSAFKTLDGNVCNLDIILLIYVKRLSYKKFSSQTENICIQEIKQIPKEILSKLEQLYGHYEYFHNYDGNTDISSGSPCNKIDKCYNLYIQYYKECQRNYNDTFREKLIMKSWLHSNSQRKKIIELDEVIKEITHSLQNTQECVNINYEGSFHNIGYHSQGNI
ncbi:PIR Superfamily Protein [Plasmodium malariae]|uniref:PIR Superfamily Protein n=1 Tax=Plasmodium malariae TaxID=5858 RepID=A0A1A8WX38_PLAMA|nr:PIR Superfamily Protein [Plasmodium malariae]